MKTIFGRVGPVFAAGVRNALHFFSGKMSRENLVKGSEAVARTAEKVLKTAKRRKK